MEETPNAKPTLTIEQFAKVFGLYLGCKAYDKYNDKVGEVFGVSQTIVTVFHNVQWPLRFDEVQLILTPLREITDEDLRTLAAYAKFEGEISIHRGGFAINIYDEHKRKMVFYHKGNFSNTSIYDKNGIEVIEYAGDIQELLRSLRYMVNYLGINLYEAGIAIKPSEANP
jgi:hypothetical protein